MGSVSFTSLLWWGSRRVRRIADLHVASKKAGEVFIIFIGWILLTRSKSVFANVLDYTWIVDLLSFWIQIPRGSFRCQTPPLIQSLILKYDQSSRLIFAISDALTSVAANGLCFSCQADSVSSTLPKLIQSDSYQFSSIRDRKRTIIYRSCNVETFCPLSTQQRHLPRINTFARRAEKVNFFIVTDKLIITISTWRIMIDTSQKTQIYRLIHQTMMSEWSTFDKISARNYMRIWLILQIVDETLIKKHNWWITAVRPYSVGNQMFRIYVILDLMKSFIFFIWFDREIYLDVLKKFWYFKWWFILRY